MKWKISVDAISLCSRRDEKWKSDNMRLECWWRESRMLDKCCSIIPRRKAFSVVCRLSTSTRSYMSMEGEERGRRGERRGEGEGGKEECYSSMCMQSPQKHCITSPLEEPVDKATRPPPSLTSMIYHSNCHNSSMLIAHFNHFNIYLTE